MPDVQVTGIATAIGIGLMIGIERERAHAGRDAQAGVRTYTLVALLGALAVLVFSSFGLIAGALIVAAFAALSYRRTSAADPGLTTEVALVLTYVLGVLAMTQPILAGGIGVLVTILLAARTRLHGFVLDTLTGQEVHDGLLLAAAALIVLPLLPDRAVDPWGVINPRLIFTLAVLFMAVNALGYVALRLFGATRGLALAGFISGFVSSSATHSAMGARARAAPGTARAAAAGAALSSVATVLQLAIVLALSSVAVLRALLWPLLASGIVAVLYGLAITWHAQSEEARSGAGRAFRLSHALGFALLMGTVIAGAALLVAWLGPRGAVIGAALAGFADAHAGALSAGSLHRSATVDLVTACVAVLAAFSTNALTKAGISLWSGGPKFALRVVPGIALMLAAAWAALWWKNI